MAHDESAEPDAGEPNDKELARQALQKAKQLIDDCVSGPPVSATLLRERIERTVDHLTDFIKLQPADVAEDAPTPPAQVIEDAKPAPPPEPTSAPHNSDPDRNVLPATAADAVNKAVTLRRDAAAGGHSREHFDDLIAQAFEALNLARTYDPNFTAGGTAEPYTLDMVEARLHLTRGLEYLKAQKDTDPRTSQKAFDAAIKLQPKWPNAYYGLARAMLLTDDRRRAADLLKICIKLGPSSILDQAKELQAELNAPTATATTSSKNPRRKAHTIGEPPHAANAKVHAAFQAKPEPQNGPKDYRSAASLERITNSVFLGSRKVLLVLGGIAVFLWGAILMHMNSPETGAMGAFVSQALIFSGITYAYYRFKSVRRRPPDLVSASPIPEPDVTAPTSAANFRVSVHTRQATYRTTDGQQRTMHELLCWLTPSETAFQQLKTANLLDMEVLTLEYSEEDLLWQAILDPTTEPDPEDHYTISDVFEGRPLHIMFTNAMEVKMVEQKLLEGIKGINNMLLALTDPSNTGSETFEI